MDILVKSNDEKDVVRGCPCDVYTGCSIRVCLTFCAVYCKVICYIV